MLGDVLLRRAERLLQLTDTGRALAQPVEQLDPHRLPEHTETLRDQLDQRLRQRVGYGSGLRHHSIILKHAVVVVEFTPVTPSAAAVT